VLCVLGVLGDSSSRSSVVAPRGHPRSSVVLSDITPTSRLYSLRLLIENRAALLSAVLILLVLLVAVFASVISPADPYTVNPADRLKGPSAAHPFGSDQLGRDVLARTIYGSRVSLLVGASVMLIAVFAGSAIGLLAGYYDRLDTPVMRVMDGLMAFPSILLAI